MHDLNRNMFYKTSFDIESTEGNGDALCNLIQSIKYWVIGKCNRVGVAFTEESAEWIKFRNGGRLESDDSEKSVVLDSESYWNQQGISYWACSVTEKKNVQGKATREWITEIGFSFREKASGTVHLVLSYADRPGYLGELQPIPEPSIPKLVRNIIENRRIKASVFGRPLDGNFTPTALHVGDFPSFWEIAKNRDRDIPVIYISPYFVDEQPLLLVNPQKVADTLGPSAFVFYSRDRDFCAEMSYSIPRIDLRCSGGAIRVYAAKPDFENPRDNARHRFFTRAAIDEIGESKILLMLRRAYAQDVHFYESMVRNETVRRMRTQEILKRDYQRKIETTEEQGIDLAESIEEKLLASEEENKGLRSEIDSLRSESHSLRMQVENYEAALNRTTIANYDLSVDRWPLPASDIMSIMRTAFSDRVDFTDRAIRSFEDCSAGAEILWNGMYDLCTVAYDLYASDQSVDVAKAFNDRSTFTLARGAGSQTRKDPKLMEAYVDRYQGRDINVESHIKKGNKEKDRGFLRIYFGFDKECSKIIISYIGGHLDNYSTRSMS